MPTTQDLAFTPQCHPIPTVPVSGVAPWVTAIAPGGLVVVDSGTSGIPLVNPGDITDSSRRLLVRPENAGTHLCLRMIYRSDDAPLTAMRLRVFAATADDETLWSVLHNLEGDTTTVIEGLSEDPYEITIVEPPKRATICHPTAHVFDGRGFSHFLVGVEVPYTVSGGGDAEDAYLQARMI